jgi:hypothetical protein
VWAERSIENEPPWYGRAVPIRPRHLEEEVPGPFRFGWQVGSRPAVRAELLDTSRPGGDVDDAVGVAGTPPL